MLSLLVSNKKIFAVLFLLFSFGRIPGQIQEKDIYKKYILRDSASIYKSAVLLFYADSTFINFGILDNKRDLDLYVWYKAGSWNVKNEHIECLANEKAIQPEELKKLIKYYYRKHRDRVLIENYYEFVYENYSNGTLMVIPGQATDQDKKIGYFEIRL